MKLKIRLLSDLCTYSGESYNTVVDTDVVYDKYGIPYIPAKRLKGCIREACMEFVDFHRIEDTVFETLFGSDKLLGSKKLSGSEGSRRSAFYLSNAYPENYSSMVKEMKSSKGKYTAQQVLELFTYTRQQTAIGLESGTAEKNTLRSMRVVKKGMIFEAELNWRDQDVGIESAEYKALEKAVSIVKHIGCGRTRGLGLVNMSLDNQESGRTSKVMFSDSDITDKNRISYEIYLNSPLICKAPTGNQAITQDYIGGGKVLGLLAGRLGPEEYKKITKKSELIVSNAYILCGGKRTIPARKSWQKEKDQGYDENNELCVLDMLCSPDVSEKQMTPAGIDYVDESGNALSVFTEISYHHKRPDDKSVGRATGKDNSSFYQLESIQAGQSFGGYIVADKEQAEKIVKAVRKMKNVRMGYGNAAEFGEVTFRLTKTEPLEEVAGTIHDIVHDVVITLVSDLIMYNEYGVPSTGIQCLKQYLAEAFGIDNSDDLAIKNPFLGIETIGGYNTTWKKMKPVLPSISKGSVFIVHSEKGFDKGKLRSLFLGERVSEGYGEVKIDEIPQKAEYIVYDADKRGLTDSDVPESEVKTEIKTDLIMQLEEREEKRKIEQRIRERAEEIKLANDIFGIAVSRILLIYKTEQQKKRYLIRHINSRIFIKYKKKKTKEVCREYKALLKQVEEIRTDKTKNACKEIVEKMDDIVKNVSKSMGGKKAYRFIYHVYLAELKYRARIQKQNAKGGKVQ